MLECLDQRPVHPLDSVKYFVFLGSIVIVIVVVKVHHMF